MKKQKLPPFEPMTQMPPKIKELFEAKGILPSAVRLFYKFDMGFELEFCDTWVAITDTELAPVPEEKERMFRAICTKQAGPPKKKDGIISINMPYTVHLIASL